MVHRYWLEHTGVTCLAMSMRFVIRLADSLKITFGGGVLR